MCEQQTHRGVPVAADRSMTLYTSKEDSFLSRIITASFEDDGVLDVSAQDMGEFVKEMWGDSDYEFGVRLKPEAQDHLFDVLRAGQSVESLPDNANAALLALLRQRFAGKHGAVDDLRALLDQHAIAYDWWQWV